MGKFQQRTRIAPYLDADEPGVGIQGYPVLPSLAIPGSVKSGQEVREVLPSREWTLPLLSPIKPGPDLDVGHDNLLTSLPSSLDGLVCHLTLSQLLLLNLAPDGPTGSILS